MSVSKIAIQQSIIYDSLTGKHEAANRQKGNVYNQQNSQHKPN